MEWEFFLLAKTPKNELLFFLCIGYSSPPLDDGGSLEKDEYLSYLKVLELSFLDLLS